MAGCLRNRHKHASCIRAPSQGNYGDVATYAGDIQIDQIYSVDVFESANGTEGVQLLAGNLPTRRQVNRKSSRTATGSSATNSFRTAYTQDSTLMALGILW